MDRNTFLTKARLLAASFIVVISAGLICVQTAYPAKPTFSGKNAYKLLKKQCEFGPRNPGTKEHRQCGEFLVSYLKQYNRSVKTQPFVFESPNGPINMFNIIAPFNMMQRKKLILCAHWDTRPWADKDPDSTKHQEPILGANDGASGVAVLLEIARLISKNPPPIGVIIVLFDGEDGGEEGWVDNFALGSKYYASHLRGSKPKTAILLDMIGDKDLRIYKEAYSDLYFHGLVDTLWNRAAEIGLEVFDPEVKYQVFDDHIPLVQAGIRAVDIIDFEYPYWHTLEDTPDKCSAKSLKQVGDFIVSILYDPPDTF